MPLVSRHRRRTLAWAGLYWAGCLALGLVLVLLRGRPSIDSDSGIFLSVAARLLAGDRLYVDVWDNKDPLFYYTFAAALGAGGWRAPFLLDALWLAVAAGSAGLLLRALGSSRVTAGAGALSYPVLLTGAPYYAGYSMLPALALAVLAAWLVVRGQLVLPGVLLGLAVLYKANLALLTISAPLSVVALRWSTPVRRREVGRLVGGVGATLAGGAAILAARGELIPYLMVLRENVSYANDVLAATRRPSGAYGHLWSVAGLTDHTRQLAIVLGVGAVAALHALLSRHRPKGNRLLAALFLVSLVATAMTLAATAVWDHHLQMLAFPSFLLVGFAASTIELRLRSRASRLALLVPVVASVLWVAGGLSRPHGLDQGQPWQAQARSFAALALEKARARRFPARSVVSYGVLGSNHEQAHAAFLRGRWRLACPRFHQYPFSQRLDGVIRCLGVRQPSLLLLTARFRTVRQPKTSWDRFANQVTGLLDSSYRPLIPWNRFPGVEVWELRASRAIEAPSPSRARAARRRGGVR